MMSGKKPWQGVFFRCVGVTKGSIGIQAIRRVGVLLGGMLLAFVLSAGNAAWSQEELFVANRTSNSVTVYSRTATGSASPLRTLEGAATGLSSPQAVALDTAANELYVVNSLPASITVYPRTASGDVAPLRIIAGPATGLQSPEAITVDLVHNELVVANFDSITVYSRTASGNAAPLRTLQGVTTGLNDPESVIVDLIHDELIVTNAGNNTITVYPRVAAGNQAPLRTLVGLATGLANPQGAALDLVRNELSVGNAGNNSITVYARTASGNAPPVRTIQGPTTGLVLPSGLVLDLVNDELIAVSSGDHSVVIFPRTAVGDAAPKRTISGAATGLTGPGLAAISTIPPLFGAVLPVSRSVQVGTSATAFGTIINAGTASVQECAPIPVDALPPLPLTYSFQTTDAQNQLTGAPNTPAIIGPSGSQNYLFAFTPTAPFAPTSVPIAFVCDGTNPAAITQNLTTLLLGASTNPGPDLIALAATPSQNGVVTILGVPGAGAFAVATVNLGTAAVITVNAETGTILPLTLLVCQTVPVTGACVDPPAPFVTLSIAGGDSPTFGIFLSASGPVPFNPSVNRIVVGFREGGVLRGATSVAVQTQ
jgi:hypothetical protein